eukprot:1523382-Prymnesium_polylepis.1
MDGPPRSHRNRDAVGPGHRQGHQGIAEGAREEGAPHEAGRRRQDQVLQLRRGGPFLVELPRREEGLEGSQETERGPR